MPNDIVTACAIYFGDQSQMVNGYLPSFPPGGFTDETKGPALRGISYWKKSLIEMKRIAKREGLDYRRKKTRRSKNKVQATGTFQ